MKKVFIFLDKLMDVRDRLLYSVQSDEEIVAEIQSIIREYEE